MNIGDRVEVIGRGITGKIVDSNSILKIHTVKFDNENFIPPIMDYEEDQLKLLPVLISSIYGDDCDCDCGSRSIGLPQEFCVHWCKSRR